MPERTRELASRVIRLDRPEQALRALAALRGRLGALEAVHVRNAREAGLSWGRIASALGISRQAAHKKHAGHVQPQLEPIALPEPGPRTVVVTGDARRAVRYAREEALALGHDIVGTGHVLLGIMRVRTSEAAAALRSLDLAPERVRSEVERLVARMTRHDGDTARASTPERLPVSRAARRAFEQSLHEAVGLGDQHLGPEHVLLALLRDERDVAVLALQALDCDPAGLEASLGTSPARAGTSD